MQDPIKLVPRHEPEVLAARSKRNSEKSRIALASDKASFINGIEITSRLNVASEKEKMAAAILSIPSRMRAIISSLDCDTKSNSYTVILRIGHRSNAALVGKSLSEALCVHTGGHNDIIIGDAFGEFSEIESDWPEE